MAVLGDKSQWSTNDLNQLADAVLALQAATVRTQIGLTASGVISEPFFAQAVATTAAPVTQTVYGTLNGLRAGDVVTGVFTRNTTAAVGTLPTTARFGIADATGKILARSGNDTALALWPLGPNPHAFAAPYTVLADGGYFACMVVDGVWGSTPPTPLFGASNTAYTAFGSAAPLNFAWTVQTDLPAVGAFATLTASGRSYYLAFY